MCKKLVFSPNQMSAYFSMESPSNSLRLTFCELKVRLIKNVNARILNGEFTERGLARILGISQPQIHNVLKGARKLHGDLGDRLLTMLDLSLMDLLRAEEFAEHQRRGEQVALLTGGPEVEALFGNGHHVPKKPPMPEAGARKTRQASGNSARF